MFDENEQVILKWSSSNKKWFEDRGYKYTKTNDEFYVSVKDLMPTSKIHITAYCDYCGEKVKTTYASYIKSINSPRYHKYACSKCQPKKSLEVNNEKRIDELYQKLKDICEQKGYTLLTHKKDIYGVKDYIDYLCPKHGVRHIMADSLLSGCNCLLCSYEHRADSWKYTVLDVKEYIESFNGNILLNPEDFIGTQEKNLKIKCGICGQTYITSFLLYQLSKTHMCKLCTKAESIGERNVRKYLENHGIEYTP